MLGVPRSLFLGALALLLAPALTRADVLPFQDASLPYEKRVDDLVGRLTTQEEISLLMMGSAAVPRLGIPAYDWWNEGLHGIAREGEATVFPQAIALAATWDPGLQQKIGDVIATEARAKNNEAIATGDGSTKRYQGLTIWSPNVNIFRDPRWGRGQETYGEDPFLTGRMAVAFVRGLQGDDPHYLKTVATLKHFCVHSGPEELRHKFNAQIDERDLHETYLPAFEAGIREGHAMSIMSAYNAVDGIPMPANTALLDGVLRHDWKFSGAVVGDVDTVGDIWLPNSHHYAADAAEASALALKAGNDLCSGTTYKALPDALKRGLVDRTDLDRAARRLLLLRFRLGQFDPPDRVPYRSIPPSEVNSPAHDQLALEAARESLVLLKNDGSLPWDPRAIKTLAVIGPTADEPADIVGNYCGTPAHPETILGALRRKLEPRGVRVLYSGAVPLLPGAREKGDVFPSGLLFSGERAHRPGLVCETFMDAKLSGSPTATRRDGVIDFGWGAAHPAPGLPARDAHLRWSGLLVPKVSGSYTLSVTFVGSAQLFLDGKAVAGEDKPGDVGEIRSRSASLFLRAGHAYPIRLEYNQAPNDSTGRIQLGCWTPRELDDALADARRADHIVLALGLSPSLEGEEMKFEADGFSHGDRTTILLPKGQRELLAKVAALGKPFTVVLSNGSALSFDVSRPNAILEAWYYGQRGGEAVAEALLGETNPSGHLPVTFYRSDDDLPDFTDYSMKHRTYRYFDGAPLFAFGHGLSYTTFHYKSVSPSSTDITPGGAVHLDVSLRNTGPRAGDEVVQVYARAMQPTVSMPREWLVGFQRIHLNPGEEQDVAISVPAERFRRWDDQAHRFVVDPGAYQLAIGSSSVQTPLTANVRIN